MSQYQSDIKRLERIARRLEPSSEARAEMTGRVFDYATGFLDKIYEVPVFVWENYKGTGIHDSPIGEDPISIEDALRLIRQNVDRPGLNPASGGHLGYIPGGGVYPASLGDYLADVTNNFAGVYFVAPGAVRMEHMLIKWMADLIGYPQTAGGDLTSGGSIANFAGVVTARDAHDLKARDFDRAVVYLTDQIHHSVTKGLRVAGLGECIVRHVDLDDRCRMMPDALERAIAKDKNLGLIPWMVCASAGTTDTGVVDPLDDIGTIAEQQGLWYHVDGAYGAFFLLCDYGKKLMGGIDKADSIVMDPHKGLFLPYGCGAIVVKERTKLQAAYSYQASYMQDADSAADEYSPADHSLELTRHYRGLRLWLPLKLFGVAPFRACLEEKLFLARHFHEEIQKIDGFEAGPFPDLSVVTYRYVPKKGDPNEFNQRLVRAVQKDGRVFLTSTLIDGKFVLRLAVLSFRTHLDRVNMALEVLQEKVKLLEGM